MVTDDQMRVLIQICELYMRASGWGALLLPTSCVSTFERGEDKAIRYQGLRRGTIMAVLGSDSPSKPSQKPVEDRGWTRKGIFEWDENVYLPVFIERSEFLIE